MQQPDGRSALSFLENALLWSMRAWVIGHHRNLDVAPQIRRLFEGFGAPTVAADLDGFMLAVSRGAKRRVNIDCVCYPGISGDESLLLDLLALQQEGYTEDSRTLLAALTAADAASRASNAAASMVLALNANGYFLARGSQAVRRHAFAHRATNTNLNAASLYLN